MAATIAKQAWDQLQEEYQGSNKVVAVKLQTLRREFENLSMKVTESVQEYFSGVTSLAQDEEGMEEVMVEDPMEEAEVGAMANKEIAMEEMILIFLHVFTVGNQIMRKRIVGIKTTSPLLIRKDHSVIIARSMDILRFGGNHMTSNRSIFVELDESLKKQVKLGDNRHVHVCGLGTIAVMTNSDRKLIHKVMYVLGRGQNLLSLGQLMKRGYHVVFDDDMCKIYEKKSTSLIYSIEMTEKKMFQLMFSKLDVNLFSVSCSNDMIWHRRYGHLNLVNSEVIEWFKQFKVTTEKQSGCSIIALRTDRGGEFTSNTFATFCNNNSDN
ncbi:uncharacterized protein [Elaeis guineensis]|uniref:uncharacterized protein n=1 Tax=Elaeis guineensis var. tenera TaxID=51953 RepID=UPI003C6D4CD5